MLPRILETEAMDTPEEAADYDAMDHSEVNRAFAEEFLELLARHLAAAGGGSPWVLDVGTGTAQIPIAIAQRRNDLHITAIDLAEHMLVVGRGNVAGAGLAGHIVLQREDAKALPYQDGAFHAVVSNSIVHHIPHPLEVLREMRRVLAPGGVLFVRDLLRPADMGTLWALVERYAAGANPHQKQMFADSLHAALSLDEVRELLRAVGLPEAWARQTSDRHWTISGTAPCC
jgi:ubiquinone/menaquinone biosynthesis C-methylase UbiE